MYVMHKIIEQLQWRYATKIFDPEKVVSDEDIETLIEVLRLTPSSFGVQPWKFLLVKNPEIKKQLVPLSRGQKQVEQAPYVFVLCGKKTIEKTDIERFVACIAEETWENTQDIMKKWEEIGKIWRIVDRAKNQWTRGEVFIALGFLLEACAVLGIDACPMGGIDPQWYDKVLWLEQSEYETVVVCPVWYRSWDDKYGNMPKARFDRDDVIEVI